MVRSGGEIGGLREEGESVHYYLFPTLVDSGEGRDWLGRGERRLVNQEAVARRHSLDRLNTINESKEKKIQLIPYGRNLTYQFPLLNRPGHEPARSFTKESRAGSSFTMRGSSRLEPPRREPARGFTVRYSRSQTRRRGEQEPG